MDVNVYLKFGKEINEHTRTIITDTFKSKNLLVNSGDLTDNDRVGFVIRNNVADIDLFVENTYKLLQQIKSLYLVAPQKCLDKIKHHPRVHCFDSKILDDPTKGITNLINFAYHGRPL
ncbi:MAG: hypothetical protein MJE63_06355 [Proteobacteria bacterium]|nr:hypothetical protein [Pseudomonadota bacterium]